ncbi:MAG: hypothetical protein ACRCVT_07480 [Leadbetterella sp.]
MLYAIKKTLPIFTVEKELREKVLVSVADLAKYQLFYNESNGVEVDLAYLIASDQVKVFYTDENEWLAGYVINTSTRLRYFEPFDEGIRRAFLRDAGISNNQICEITCIKITKKLTKMNPMLRLEIYQKSIHDAIAMDKEIIIGGSIQMTVWKTFEIILPRTLYFGVIPHSGGQVLGKIVFNQREEAQALFNSYLNRVHETQVA